MSDTTDLIKLYSKRILALAASIPHTTPLETPMGSAKKRSPLCGSNIQVALNVKDGVVTEFSQDVKACALGQASASVVGSNIIGRTRGEIETGRDQLFAMLTKDGPVPDAPFDELIVLESAKDYRNRHASIMLAFDTTLVAFDDATTQSQNA
ncbi:iron-sulfur cluster scaffold-like protein [Amylibacter ulvae]|uniref:Iron-sulfur cluster scaffold-like protein n=1 Tax=Paramylibacter ulvae TaxID=1651968 RepID=A0ABQ3CSN2_9RHOB|nr:iron-sulfur cluster assembly scaffold protein [Amylibacter ulvae]GHA42216.1 iron-sulfur cluster scaffold-like protein [Amylibacter ulvae]